MTIIQPLHNDVGLLSSSQPISRLINTVWNYPQHDIMWLYDIHSETSYYHSSPKRSGMWSNVILLPWQLILFNDVFIARWKLRHSRFRSFRENGGRSGGTLWQIYQWYRCSVWLSYLQDKIEYFNNMIILFRVTVIRYVIYHEWGCAVHSVEVQDDAYALS